jgi:hypothetical protein
VSIKRYSWAQRLFKKNGSTNHVGISPMAMANFEMKGNLKMLRETMWNRSSKCPTYLIKQGRFSQNGACAKRMARNGIDTITCILLKRKNRINIFIESIFELIKVGSKTPPIFPILEILKSFDKTRISFVVKIREET